MRVMHEVSGLDAAAMPLVAEQLSAQDKVLRHGIPADISSVPGQMGQGFCQDW
jgi:hypothetical protein